MSDRGTEGDAGRLMLRYKESLWCSTPQSKIAMIGLGSSRVPASGLAIVRFLVGLQPASGVAERPWLAVRLLQSVLTAEFHG